MIGGAQVFECPFLVLVERAHEIPDNDERAAPDGDVQPLARNQIAGRRLLEPGGVEVGEQHHEQHAREGRERRVPPAVRVGREHRWERVEPQHHALGIYEQVHHRHDDEQRQQQPELLVGLFEGLQDA